MTDQDAETEAVIRDMHDRVRDTNAALVCRFDACIDLEDLRQRHAFLFYAVNARHEAEADYDVGTIKYAAEADRHMRQNLPFMPALAFMRDRSVYESGVGPGYQMYLLQKLLNCDMQGCDMYGADHQVFGPIREALGLTDRVHDRTVRYGEDLGIPEGSEVLMAFWPGFMKTKADGDRQKPWGVVEHTWFLETCSDRLTGARKVVLRFNRAGFMKNREVMALYRDRGVFPLPDDNRFCIVSLD